MEVSTLFNALKVELGLELVAGRAGLDRGITGDRVQKPALALTGFTSMLSPGVVQIFGKTELDYLWSLPPVERRLACDFVTSCSPPAIIVTRGLDVPEQLLESADHYRVPLLLTGLRSSLFIEALHKFLATRMAQIRAIHGVLVDVFGVGVLIIGKSGIGKSECALELIMRGHRLVADDVVDVSLVPPSTIIGAGNELIRHHMEIRGLGIINIKDLFGVAAIRETKKIELVINMEEWDASKSFDRLGIVMQTHDILGVMIPRVDIPVRPGRTLTAIVEVAARNQILKSMGHHSARDFQSRMDAASRQGAESRNSRIWSTAPHALSSRVIDDKQD
ncbi:MAG: HPr(Ser) kinase/phosphatase [Proteobacteria bacterium]|nr:HPr(Ser) kinase/phosphatase [Pseudomonadota bacterium]